MKGEYPNACECLQQPSVQPRLYDVDTTCQLLSISKSPFYILVKEGRLAVSKLGRKTLVTSYAIRDFVQAAYATGITDQDFGGGDVD